jgi:mono/diheme cytochrome c family protein
MKRTSFLLALGAGALALLLSSCTNGTEDTTTSTAVTTTAPAPSVLVSDTKDSSNCVDCHTDQGSLQAMAVEPVEESLNEGEG